MESTRGRRHARTAQAVLDAALEIIAESSIEALSMREIARRIEYSPSGLYEYFASKDELLGALSMQGFARLTEHLQRTVRGDTAPQRLLEAGTAYLDFARQQPQLYLLMFNCAPEQGKAGITLAQFLQALATNTAFAVLLSIIRAGVANGAFKTSANSSVELLAYGSWAHMHGLAMLRLTLLGTAVEDVDVMNREILRTYIAHMTAP